jgi:AsmA protein
VPMPRRYFLGFSLVCLAVVSALATPWALSKNGVSIRVAQKIAEETGLKFTAKGRATIAFLPVPRVKIENVAFDSNEGEHLAHARYLRGDIRILPLLLGRIEVSGFYLYEPRLNATWDGASLVGLSDVWRRFAEPATRGSSYIERIALVGGGAALRNASGDVIGEARDINVVIVTPTTTTGMIIGGSLKWRNEHISVAFDGASPALQATPKGGPMALQLKSTLASLSFNGTGSSVGDARYIGSLAVETRSLRDLGRLMRIDAPFSDAVGPMSVEGQASLSARGLDIATASIKLNNDLLEGALAARIENGRVSLTGTLDSSSLDLGLLFSEIAPLRVIDGNWSHDALDWSDMSAADLDLRISAATGRIGALRLSDLALGVLLNQGKMELNMSRATAYRGTVRGRFSLSPSQLAGASAAATRVEAKANLMMDKVDAGALMSHLGKSRSINGLMHGQFTSDGSGQSVAEIVQSANGKAAMIIRQGEFIGVNFADALRAAERRPLSVAVDWRGGRSAFEQLSLNIGMKNGIAEIVSGTLSASQYRGTISGTISLNEQNYALRTMLTGIVAGREGPTLPVTISGPWDNPAISPDMRALLERSMPASSLVARQPAAPIPAIGDADTLSIRAVD